MWSHVECGFDIANETIVFGSRQLAEVDGLYESSTIAIINTEEQVYDNPSVHGSIKGGKIFLAIDSTFRILSNDCTSLDLYTSFESVINCFSISFDNKILILCLNDGNIFCLHIPSNGKLIYSFFLEENINKTDYYIFSTNDENSISFLISSQRNIYRLKINNINDVYNKIENNDEEIEENFNFCNLNIKINSILTSFSYEDKLYYVSNRKCFADCDNFFLALGENDTVICISKLTKMVFKLNNIESVKDLMFLKGLDSEDHQMLIRYTQDDANYIKLLSYPSFDVICNLKVSEHTYFISIDNDQDNIIFIEGICNKSSNVINELRIKMINKSSPDEKLKRLLRRKCFEDAKTLARTFNLDMQPIYIAETKEYINKNNFHVSCVDEFCNLLDNVEDIICIIEYCLLKITVDSLENVEQLLNYSYKRLENVLLKNSVNSLTECRSTLLNLYFKLDTFKILYCEKEFPNSESLMNAWLMFLKTDLYEEMQTSLMNGNIDHCTLLFTRLQQDNVLHIEKIQQILLQIPNHMPLNETLPLLHQLLTFSLNSEPDCFPVIINWVYDNIINPKISQENWLKHIINFCEHITQYFDVENVYIQRYFAENGCLTNFKNLVRSLKDLQILRNDYNINLSITELLKDPHDVVLNLLDEISSKQIKDFMNNFLIIYCKQYMINIDEALLKYIKFISKSEKLFWDQSVILLIPFISSISLKMKTILTVLENASVPWSNTIEKLAEYGGKECHPLAEKISNLKQNIPWKIMLNMYNIPEQSNYSDNDIMKIIRIILKYSKQNILQDIDVIISKSPILKGRAQLLIFNHFVQTGQMESALQYLNSVENEIILDCFTSVEIFLQSYLIYNTGINYAYFLEILSNSLLMRLKLFLEDYEFEIYENRMKRIKNIIILKEKFKCDEITNFDFDLHILLPKLIRNIISSVKENKLSWSEAINKCEEIALLLELPKDTCFFELEEQVVCLKGLNACAQNMLYSDSNVSNWIKMALLLMKNIHHTSLESEDLTIALQLINKLALKSFIKSDLTELSLSSELLNWNNGCFWFKKYQNNILNNWRISPLFQPEHFFTLSNSTVLVIKEYFDILTKIARIRILCRENLIKNKVDENWKDMMLRNLDLLPEKMKQLRVEGYDMTVYNLLHVIKKTLLSIEVNEEFYVKIIERSNYIINSQCIVHLLDKILVSKKIDCNFALYLFMSSDFQPLKWIPVAIKKYKLDMKKLHAVSSLACCYVELRGSQENSYEAYSNLKFRCEWWQKCLHHFVSYYDTFQLTPDEILTTYLLKSNNFSLKILKKFCRDFGLNIQKFLMLYLHNTLLFWRPTIENGVISTDDKLFKKCKEIISEIEDKIAAVQQLDKVWSEISYYQHEVYLCILDLFVVLEKNCTNPDKAVLLMFLKDYRRINKPQQKEIDDYHNKYTSAREIDQFSNYRLPYFLEMHNKKFWDIIRPEINLMTYKKWYIHAPYLELDRNLVCVFAIKGTINSGILNSNDNWSVTLKHESLLELMEMCVEKIDDPQMATAVLYTAVRKVTGGANQVAIAKICWKKAKQWRNSANKIKNDVQLKYSDVKRKYFNCLTMHLLHCYNLDTEQYLNLIENTEQLIRKLYNDKSIVERRKGSSAVYPDINGIVDELSTQLSVDVTQIKTCLIMEFLHASCKIVDFDESVFVSSINKQHFSAENNYEICDNLKRVIYICESREKENWCNLLSNISIAILDDTISNFDSSPDLFMRIKALRCLLVITKDISKLEDTIGESPNIYLEKLEILLSLQSIGYSITIPDLDTCTKIDLISKILRSKNPNAMVVSSLAKMCAIYDIWDSVVWNKIIQRFIDLKMLIDLQKWLPKLYKFCFSPVCDCPYVMGWFCLIKNVFVNALCEKQNYSRCFTTIQSCPVVSMLEPCFLEIFDLYFQKNIFEICTLLIPYIQNRASRKKVIDQLNLEKNQQLCEKI